jgi:hypothetical protein
MIMSPVDAERIAGAKWSFVARRQPRAEAVALVANVGAARAGDLVLGAIAEIGQHKRLQLADGRHSQLWPGDLVVVACGARYAPDQFECVAELAPDGADLVAGGGIVGRLVSRRSGIGLPTRLRPLGLLADRHGRVLNLARHALLPSAVPAGLPALALLGTSMNSGKTTAAAALVHGLARAGIRVGAAKITGTGAFGDLIAYADAGAHLVCDFTDAGMASTCGEPLARIEAGAATCLAWLRDAGCNAAVVEVADGIFQQETAALIAAPAFRRLVGGVIFAAGDALSAVYGAERLRAAGLLLLGVSGRFTAAPLACREAAAHLSLPILRRDDLLEPATATGLLARAQGGADVLRQGEQACAA